MKKGTSLYLDLVRFSAALAVFFNHTGIRGPARITHAWRFYSSYYAQTAVIVFFVLSGYVIAHVIATREQTVREYSASRFGRLYSVVIPALLLVGLSNFLGVGQDNDPLYHETNRGLLPYLGTSLFLNRFWSWPTFEPPDSNPFWSLSFEVAYYVAIALVVFAKGRARFLSLILLGLLAGPTIVILAPVWFLGYGAYHYSQRQRLPMSAGTALWLISALLLLLCFLFEERFRMRLPFLRIPHRTLGAVFADYVAGVCFTVNIVAFNVIAGRAEPFLKPFTRTIRWLGSLTFALYLFHYPLLHIFSFYSVGLANSFGQWIWQIGGTFLIVATLGHFCERSKGAYKRWFLSVWGAASRRLTVS